MHTVYNFGPEQSSKLRFSAICGHGSVRIPFTEASVGGKDGSVPVYTVRDKLQPSFRENWRGGERKEKSGWERILLWALVMRGREGSGRCALPEAWFSRSLLEFSAEIKEHGWAWDIVFHSLWYLWCHVYFSVHCSAVHCSISSLLVLNTVPQAVVQTLIFW